MNRVFRALLLLSLVASACSARPTIADESFVEAMLPHHDLGLELLDQAGFRASDVRLRRLVFEMSGYHRHEVELLSERRNDWGLAAASDFPGRISSNELARLNAAQGGDYDELWLELMIRHHEGAIEISRAAINGRASQEISRLAGNIITVQTSEVEQMRALLGQLVAETTTTP